MRTASPILATNMASSTSLNRDALNTFDAKNLPDLDVAVLGALELFMEESLPNLPVDIYKRPLVVGSGNAEATGKILFEETDAIFASESNFEKKLQDIPDIDGVVIVSASGGKHAPVIAEGTKKYRKDITLITNAPNSKTKSLLDGTYPYTQYVFPKNREPYTYNTSSYMGMILGYTKEDPAKIYTFIE